MQKLNLPEYQFNIKKEGNRLLIFDELRKRFIVLTPEEWVRQNLIKYLIQEKDFPPGLISLEAEINVNNLRRRYDGLVLSKKDNSPLVLIECKAPSVTINQKVFDQIFAYNTEIIAPYLFISNGLKHFFLATKKGEKPEFISSLPVYAKIDK
jgi:hypothetical protein